MKYGMHTDPDIAPDRPEDALRRAILKELEDFLAKKKSDGILEEYFILEDFGLDIAVFMKFNNQYAVRFFELKAFTGSRPAGVGFGNRKGQGSQVDLLLLGDSQLGLADQFIRWILVDGTQPGGSSRYVVFSNHEAKNAAMNGVRRGKQNNFRVNHLMKNAITWPDLIKTIRVFLIGKGESTSGT
jgi:hypothetical protein